MLASNVPTVSFGLPVGLNGAAPLNCSGVALSRPRRVPGSALRIDGSIRRGRESGRGARRRSSCVMPAVSSLRARQSPSHDNPTRRIETPATFVFDNCTQRRTEFVGWNDIESESRVKRHVPRDISEGCQADRLVPGRSGPSTDVPHETPPETAPAMLRVYVDFLEMCAIGLDHLDVGKTHRQVVSQDDPEVAITLSLLQHIVARRFIQNRLGCVSGQKTGSGELYGGQQPDIPVAGRGDGVSGGHMFSGSRDLHSEHDILLEP